MTDESGAGSAARTGLNEANRQRKETTGTAKRCVIIVLTRPYSIVTAMPRCDNDRRMVMQNWAGGNPDCAASRVGDLPGGAEGPEKVTDGTSS